MSCCVQLPYQCAPDVRSQSLIVSYSKYKIGRGILNVSDALTVRRTSATSVSQKATKSTAKTTFSGERRSTSYLI